MDSLPNTYPYHKYAFCYTTPMTLTATDLFRMLPETVGWLKSGDDFLALTYNPVTDARSNVPVPAALLEEIQTGFSHALRALILCPDKIGTPAQASGHLVCDTLRVLRYGVVELEDAKGYARKLVNIKSISPHISLSDRVQLRATVVYLRETKAGSQVYTFVIESRSSDVTVLKTTLDRAYPGWSERLATTEALDLNEKQAMVHVFLLDRSAINPDTTLPDIAPP